MLAVPQEATVRTLRLALVALTLTLAAGLPAQAANFYAVDARFPVEVQGGQTKRGAPIVTGYVFNKSSNTATDVRVRIETLDANGQPVAETLYRLFGEVQAGDRSYFEAPIRTPGASYRATVVSYSFVRS